MYVPNLWLSCADTTPLYSTCSYHLRRVEYSAYPLTNVSRWACTASVTAVSDHPQASPDWRLFQIWDIQDQNCLLTVRPKGHMIRGDLQACHYSHHNKSLAVATDQMALLNLKLKYVCPASGHMDHTHWTHTVPVSHVSLVLWQASLTRRHCHHSQGASHICQVQWCFPTSADLLRGLCEFRHCRPVGSCAAT